MKYALILLLFIWSSSFLHSQNVGIGTTSPNNTLTITDDSTPTLEIGSKTSDQSLSGRIFFNEDITSSALNGFELQHNAFIDQFILSRRLNALSSNIATFNSDGQSDFLYKMTNGSQATIGGISLDVHQRIRMRHGAATGYTISSNSLGEMTWVHPTESLLYSLDRNVVIGQDAGLNLSPSGSINGQRNVIIGQESGKDLTTGQQNVYLGYWSGKVNDIGAKNVALGTYANERNNGGNENVVLGYSAGRSLGSSAAKNGNVFIGAYAGQEETGSNKLYIENSNLGSPTPLIYGDFATDELKINGSLEVTNNANVTGNLIVSSSITATDGITASDNNTTTPDKGVLYKNSGPFAYGRIGSSGTLGQNYGIDSVTKTATGTYTISLGNSLSQSPVVITSAHNVTSRTTTYSYSGIDKSITVMVFNGAGVLVDNLFSIVVFAY